MLRQALMARRALILLDGLDEGGVATERIVRHITQVPHTQSPSACSTRCTACCNAMPPSPRCTAPLHSLIN